MTRVCRLDLSAVVWRKSSYSNKEGGACVEVAFRRPGVWRKSSYSNQEGGDCVEVADGFPVVPVRDSKVPDGPILTVSSDAWASFVAFAARSDI